MATTHDFDFDRSVEQAWRRFTERLGVVLSMMDETEPLTLQPYDPVEGRWQMRFVQNQPDHVMIHIHLGDDAVELTEAELANLTGLGWKPDAAGLSLTDEQDDCAILAKEAVTALRQVFMVEHPVFLESNVLSDILQEPIVDDLDGVPGIEAVAFHDLDQTQLTAMVTEELAAISQATLMRDQDGDLAVRFGSTMLFVRIPADGQEIRLFSVLVHDVAGRSRAAEVLNDINAHARWVRFSLVRDKIIATMPILAAPFVPAHFRQAVAEMIRVADGVDDLLADSLQGKTTFPSQT